MKRIGSHVLATSADMVCCSHPWPSTFLRLSDRSSSRLVDRVRMAIRVEVACLSKERRDGCDSGLERAACHCESPSDFADVARPGYMRAQEPAWAIGDGCGARRPCRASGVGCTSYYYDVLKGAKVARLTCHRRGDRCITGDSSGQAEVRVSWADRVGRAVDGGRQQRADGCAVVAA